MEVINNQHRNYQPFLESLDNLGFCTFKLFDDIEIAALKELYQTHFGNKQVSNLYASHNSNPIEKSLAVNSGIKKIIESKLQSVFTDFDYFIGHFMVKGANTVSEFALHQDWNIVDEAKYKSYQLWIPLQLTYASNGGLFVVPGSHKFFGNFRSGSYDIPRIPFDDNLKRVVTNIVVPQGNIVCYQNATLHGSYPNTTYQDRVVVLVNVVQKNAPVFYFHKNENKACTELYDLTPELLVQHLPSFEKGRVDDNLKVVKTMPTSTVSNADINSANVLNAFANLFGNQSSHQLKQLHIAKEQHLEQTMNENGYAIIDFLDEATVVTFLDEYKKHFGHIDRTPGRFTTLQHTDAAIKKHIHNFIVTNVEATMQKYFKEYFIPVAQFYTKKAFTSGDIDIHADSTLLLNHQLEPHYAIWVPLMDLDEANGTLSVIPFSHKISEALFTASYEGYHFEHVEWLRQFDTPLRLKAGQAVVFDNNLLHNSTANQSSFDRIAFTFRITHKASTYYSFFCKNDVMEVSEENQDYYMNDKWDGNAQDVTGKHLGTLTNGVLHVSRIELEQTLKTTALQ